MRLSTIKIQDKEVAAVVTEKGLITIETLNKKESKNWKTDIFSLIETEELEDLNHWYKNGGKEKLESIGEVIKFEDAVYAPLYRNPKRIFGIGLNYVDHAGDLGEKAPTGFPGSFYKPASTIVGHKDEIHIPKLAEAKKTTAEAELGIIISKKCKFIDKKDWKDYVAGYTTILDMTEESILRQNPRFLTIAKGFDTFFSFGPELVTPDEVEDVLKLKVQTVHNGEVHAENVVSNMMHQPDELVSLISHIQGWYPGDILSTGTPRAVAINDSDTVECRISGEGMEFRTLENPVVDLKLKK
ncbi:fumarylacetoacetate hydrolase family protein [Peptoniphilus catoniae]|uniref:fumarylacetoacetate hydrolase family protein n=1 Tax=Peptoniphilus catoniae TaxID=1660341 RepID=UPI0010FD8085|nr:fumarylacetoacetate hydrolase family protein [Peptoniphilus catoniae]